MKQLKVVTAEEMSRIEKKAYAQGCSEIDFMENAGKLIAEAIKNYLLAEQLEKKVTLIVGKGNNGGDSYVAGRILIEKGFSVVAYHPYSLEECSSLCREQGEKFKKIGGTVVQKADFQGVIIDGLVGTGFKGKAEGVLADTINKANHSGLPILAIDIPSGLNGNTGEVETVAIRADMTIALGLPKIGFFIGKGWDHVGELVYADFGLPNAVIEEAQAEAYLLDEGMISKFLPPIKRSRHKYEAGYVLSIAGSAGMTGAAILSSFAALCSGAGIVRLFYPKGLEEIMAKAPLELLTEAWNFDLKRITEEAHRAKSFLIGPGLGRTPEVQKMLETLLPQIRLPSVLDADALYFLSENPKQKLPEATILTPHHKEMERLLHTELSFAACQCFVKENEVTLVLKGAPTVIFHPQKEPLIVPRGDPGMATAGTGDVLTGILAALLAQGLETYKAAALGVYLHALAGEIAAMEKTSYCLVASDLIDYLPDAFSLCLNK